MTRTSHNPATVALISALMGALVAGACSSESPSVSDQVRAEVAADVPTECSPELSLQLYERRIAPLLAEERPKSCSQCHLSGLNLELFVKDTPCETMACMTERGLIDQNNPDASLILSWIGRAEPDSTLITERVVAEEYEGFRQWIEYNLQCGACQGVTCPTGDDYDAKFCEGSPEISKDFDPASVDPGGCDAAALESLLRDTIYSSRGRCSPCHYTDHEFEPNGEDEWKRAPQWLDVTGECAEGVSRTLRNIQRLGLIDQDEPTQSLLLQKPLPEDLGGVEHLGHDKFYSVTEDPAYRAFLYFIERYVDCQSALGSYP